MVVPSGRGSTKSLLMFKRSASVTSSKTSSSASKDTASSTPASKDTASSTPASKDTASSTPTLSSNSICNGSSMSPSKSSSEALDSASLVELELD